MTIEQIVEDALRAADSYEPSPDLFDRVRRSIEEDASHRRRVRWSIGVIALALLAVGVYLAITVRVVDGVITMSFSSLEWLTTAAMSGIIATLGPSIRRFGEAYEAAVFRSSPETGASVLRLLDVAYYLIFGGYVLVTLVYDPALEFGPAPADWLRGELVRLGGLLLLMGVLHVLLVLALPVMGLVHAVNLRRLRVAAGHAPSDPVAALVDRVVTVLAWVCAALVALNLLGWVLNAVLIVGQPG